MGEAQGPRPRPIGRVRFMDAQRVNLDGFAAENTDLGMVAYDSPADPAPSLVLREGRVVEMDGRAEADFDSIDEFVARHGLDLDVAEEAMAVDDLTYARMLVDPAVPRAELVRLAAGMTPAKLAAPLALLRPVELMVAMTKVRARRTPSNQAHVTNRLDDPLLLAADAATAAAFGFRELETTVPVLNDAPSNALAVTLGSVVGAAGVLVQCSVEEALELELGMRGFVSYAETVSLYGTHEVFVDGDDTPWSKALLASAYASRGVKMRVTSGGGAEALMGGAQGHSMFYLEARCVALARAIGAQGVQNGGIDSASVAASVPKGVRSLTAENLMVMLRNLESCSGNDALMSESDMRRTARTLPTLLAGSDFICSGFGSIQRFDNMFGPSNLNAEDIDDYLAIQRDWGVDGGLRTADADDLERIRRRAAQVARDVYAWFGLADFGDEQVELAVDAAGSKDLGTTDTLAVLNAALTIKTSGMTGLDVVSALEQCGYPDEARRLLDMLAARVSGDYLQTAAIFDESMNVLSLVTDPNDYLGPGTGYDPTPERQAEIDAIRQERSVDDLRRAQDDPAEFARFSVVEEATVGTHAGEVVVGLSPAVGRAISRTLSGLSVSEALAEILAGLEEEGCTARLVRVNDSIDLGSIGLKAARLAGSGIGIGLQAKGTALIHRRDLPPLANLELYSVAPTIGRADYRLLGVNAGRHAKGATPDPARNPYSDEAIEARYHTRVVALVAIERTLATGAPPEELAWKGER
ncbi:MAG TPA: propanediol/glycerol family dehydratase large subunit [Nocardioides sp.]|uniref:propanediol/glycerol family dehydratase large subunit n=1 Tax=Nocardioides sp. TaxID=35761 RepID=UPI002E2EDF42|nr:propanediol/glycerol family dehydratase large subunit [Nocardioides sp.]HEX3931322.1 propanediol/glycerol family dehydratase large subunit [Nocardioides sp.]